MSEVIWLGRDNEIKLLFTVDGTPLDISASTQAVFDFGDGVIVDSADYPGEVGAGQMFDFSLGATGVAIFRLGAITGVVAGRYRTVELTIMDPVATNGIVWGELDITVRETF